MFLNRPLSLSSLMAPGKYYLFQYKMLSFQCPPGHVQSSNMFFDERCFTGGMVHDRKIAFRLFGVRLLRWFSHTPRLWHKPSLHLLEDRLSAQLLVSRRNHLRHDATDLFWQVMFESFLSERARRGGVHVVPIDITRSSGKRRTVPAFHAVFASCEPAKINQYMHTLDRTLGALKTAWVGVEDSLPAPASADCIHA